VQRPPALSGGGLCMISNYAEPPFAKAMGGTLIFAVLLHKPTKIRVVGQGRLELPTSRLSGVHSNQLSYWPVLLVWLRTSCPPADIRKLRSCDVAGASPAHRTPCSGVRAAHPCAASSKIMDQLPVPRSSKERSGKLLARIVGLLTDILSSSRHSQTTLLRQGASLQAPHIRQCALRVSRHTTFLLADMF